MALDAHPLNAVSGIVIGSAIAVHRALGPGLLESAYQRCLERELTLRSVAFASELEIPVRYRGKRLDCGYRLDLVVENCVAVEVKSVEQLIPIHNAQVLTYLRLSGLPVGLLINFNVKVLRHGIRRLVWRGASAGSASPCEPLARAPNSG